MSTPESGLKTLALRMDPAIHAQLSFIAQLRERTINDEGIAAVVSHIEQAKKDPELQAKAEAAQREIEREAAVKNAAIANIFTDGPTGKTAPPSRAPSRRSGEATKDS
ncbi:hypothetical protein [Mycobacteroides abscessus]|uniref:hypothetical protein n=1 Tax=Mycobacteroides abscessus TaxID=36809 RepID=UPI000926527D|nr:hypothetical protein [Mycobacteroides abscessus]SHV16525.1 Uncharacterised protein [Mycobacteroides abscessus subsp. abscessus]SHV36302.1 Uncharacterised protein [Mycobacteroides abscessus subsp. abscessus]SHV58285.1 Uncharacterised protein [Mycobacteroides abscessus subsp. abscessus]SHW24780.1 Uncharacterised protein [Mycobacteroides abscessus subsp. abscessus]SHW62055.1 Uncharacterised protein [Mycobacteroides abscessus subsp. abscessus]